MKKFLHTDEMGGGKFNQSSRKKAAAGQRANVDKKGRGQNNQGVGRLRSLLWERVRGAERSKKKATLTGQEGCKGKVKDQSTEKKSHVLYTYPEEMKIYALR